MRGFYCVVLVASSIACWLCFSPTATQIVRSEVRNTACKDAVARLQRAVKNEARTRASYLREACHFRGLSEDERAGKPEAIFKGLGQSYQTALNESTAARKATEGCDTSSVRLPRISTTDPNSANIFKTCLGPSLLFEIKDLDERARVYEARSQACSAALEQLNCESTRVENDPDDLVFTDVTEIIVPPADLKPACRTLYVDAENARREYEKAQKRVSEVENYSSMGPKGAAIYQKSVQDQRNAATKYYRAKDALDKCSGNNAGGNDTGKRDDVPKMPAVRSCTADEMSAFSSFSGAWKGYRTHVTISGSCESVSGSVTWIEYCEGIEQPYNKNLTRYVGTIKGGRMEGSSISLPWTQPAAGGHEESKGTANCTVSGGTLNCSGFGCAASATK
jgi:hypothetical protein